MRVRVLVVALCCCIVVLTACGDDGTVTPEPEVSCVDGSVETPGSALAIELADGYAYVENWALPVPGRAGDGLQIIDVSVPDAPEIVSSLDLGRLHDFVVRDDTLYTSGDRGFQMFDVATPESPVLIGGVDESIVVIAGPVAVAGDYAYLGDRLSATPFVTGFHVADISDPSQPQVVGTVELPSLAPGMSVAAGYLYATSTAGMHVFDLTDPEMPEEVAIVDLPGIGQDVVIVGGYAYGIVWSGDWDHLGGGLFVVDVRQPEAPDLVGYESVEYPGRFALQGGFVYLAGNRYGIQIIDVRNPELPETIFTIEPAVAYAVAVSSDHLLVTDGALGLLSRECEGDPTW